MPAMREGGDTGVADRGLATPTPRRAWRSVRPPTRSRAGDEVQGGQAAHADDQPVPRLARPASDGRRGASTSSPRPERRDRLVEPTHEHVVGVVGRDREHRDARRGERFRHGMEHADEREVERVVRCRQRQPSSPGPRRTRSVRQTSTVRSACVIDVKGPRPTRHRHRRERRRVRARHPRCAAGGVGREGGQTATSAVGQRSRRTTLRSRAPPSSRPDPWRPARPISSPLATSLG